MTYSIDCVVMGLKRIVQILLLTATIVLFTICPTVAVGSMSGIEEIIDYKSEITVNTDSSLKVTETMVVNALGQEIRHGIYRDFPISYRDAYGNRYKVRFQVQGVTRDGSPESYVTKKHANGERIYIGDSSTYVTPGIHTYSITYLTGRQLGYFKDHDELYWNVTGNGWVFPIEKASAIVKLPAGIPGDQVKVGGFTGVYGSQEQAYTPSVDSEQNIIFSTTRPLNANEGLTIVVAWPKGYVVEPDWTARITEFLQDNQVYFLIFLGILAVFFYYLIIWDRYGRDPVKGTVMPLYHPPANLSPAAARFIHKMGFDTKVLTSTVIHLAVLGAVDIYQDDNQYSLKKKDVDPSGFSPEEAAVYHALPYEGFLTLRNSNYENVQRLTNACRNALESTYEGNYFIRNNGYWIAGVTISGLILGCVFLMEQVSTALVVAGILLAALNAVFYYLLKAPTLVGRKIIDQIEGFRLFLSTAEKERLNTLYPGGRTP
ncbi:MAG TPA: DUF2207 domain-containing protein, partial [Bacillota bacterium]|nr:DUF2207 domain-containing protein [Bacillota bacterium]